MRRPVIEAAGIRDDGHLWVHVGGIDATRTRWVRGADGRWTSEEPPEEPTMMAAWGGSARTACDVALQSGEAFVLDTPVERPDGAGEALAAGFLDEERLYAVHERGVQVRRIDVDCSVGDVATAWRWEEPELRRALALPEPGSLRIVGAGEHGVWRHRFETGTAP